MAAGKEPIGTSLVGLGASLKLVAFLRKKGVKVEITQEQEELLVLGRTTFDLWTDVQTEAKKTGKLLPAWYAKLIFDQEMSQHATLLREYQDALEDHRKGTEGALDRGMTAVRSVLDSIRPAGRGAGGHPSRLCRVGGSGEDQGRILRSVGRADRCRADQTGRRQDRRAVPALVTQPARIDGRGAHERSRAGEDARATSSPSVTTSASRR